MIAGKAVCFGEALRPDFKDYAAQVVANAKTLAEELTRAGFRLASGGTDNHLILIDMTSKGLTGKIAEAALGRAGITVNKNLIPFDTAQAPRPERHPHGHARPDDPRDEGRRDPPGRGVDRPGARRARRRGARRPRGRRDPRVRPGLPRPRRCRPRAGAADFKRYGDGPALGSRGLAGSTR